MYEKTFFIFIIIIISVLLVSCNSSKFVSCNPDGTDRIEELESAERSNETELAVTGTRLQCEVEEATKRGIELEQSIGSSKEYEQRIDSILCQVEKRSVGYDFYIEWKNRQTEEQ